MKKNISPDMVLFNVNQVAELVGVVPTTIRNWEKNGLFIPRRSPSNYRVFNLNDIETLKKIKEYSVDSRMSVKMIKMLLPDQDNGPLITMLEQERGNVFSKKLLSSKWRQKREALGYTLEYVSRTIGISTSHLSKLENGNANVSLPTLQSLADFYGESTFYFFDLPETSQPLIKKNQGREIPIGIDGVRMESLVSAKEHILFPIKYTVLPGCGNPQPHTHGGEEFLYILSGNIQITVEKTDYLLEEGDSLLFRGNQLHRWLNASATEEASLLWMHTPLVMDE